MEGWSDALRRFEGHLQQAGLARNTIAGYRHDLQRFALWLLERAGQEVPPDAFASGDVEAYKEYLRSTIGRSPASINRYLQSVRKFGRFAVAAGLREGNPAEGVRLLEGSALSAAKTLSALEVERLMRAAEGRHSPTAVRDYAILQVLLQTGIRASELVRLRQSDLDLSRGEGTLTVCARERRPERQIPLNAAARHALIAYYLEQPRPAGARPLFLSRKGRLLSIRSVQQIVASLGKAAGLDISAKTLRDTYARFLWQETGDLALLMARLGHRRPETALKYITHLSGAGSATETLVHVHGEQASSTIR